ncbi:MAG: polysaccharide biosynthesis tyrosine autokinase [bacterium]
MVESQKRDMEEFFEEPIQEGESFDIFRYVKALLRRWWLILLIFSGVAIPWTLYVKSQPPVYEAEVWITFQNVGREMPENVVQDREVWLRSRSFAEEVAAELGLTLQLVQEENHPALMRQDVFRTFSTIKTPVEGRYDLRFHPSGFLALYYGTERLDSLRVDACIGDSTVSYNGFTFSLNPDIVKDRPRVAFVIRNFRGTVGSLQSRENIVTNLTGTQMKITLKDRNPILASQTVNMLAEILVRKSLEMGRDRDRLISNYLQGQLAVVQRDLEKTDYEMKSFRNDHLMGLDQTTRQTVERLDDLERQVGRLTMERDELSMLLRKLDASSPDFDTEISQPYVYRQIARRPVFENSADMTIARDELEDLIQARNTTLQTYPETNPRVLELSENIQAIETKIYNLGNAKVKELNDQISDVNRRMGGLQKNLEVLPEEELKQIKLARQRKTNESLYDLYMTRYKEAMISEAVVSENISIVDRAMVPGRPIQADKAKKTLMGLFLGLSLGIGFAFVLEMADKSIKTRDDVKRYLNLPILGIIPMVKFDDYELQDSEKAKSISSQIVTHDYSPTPVGEAYRSLRTNLLFSKRTGPIRTLVIGSVSPGEGKSFTAANLAITLAQQKSRTLLIDADLRRGVLHNSFNCRKKPGLTNYLTGVVSLEDVLYETYVPNLTLITCGSLIPNPSELLGSFRMKRFIEGITKRFDFVIFDSPPLIAATDTVILGTLVDGIAVLIRAGKTNRDEVQRKLEIIRNVQANIVGAILNCAGVEVAHDGYSYYRY